MQYAASMDWRRRNGSLFSLGEQCVCARVCNKAERDKLVLFSRTRKRRLTIYVRICKNISFYRAYSRKIVALNH